MLPIAGQTAGLIGLTFFVGTHWWPGGVIGLKIELKKNFFNILFFLRATPDYHACLQTIIYHIYKYLIF